MVNFSLLLFSLLIMSSSEAPSRSFDGDAPQQGSEERNAPNSTLRTDALNAAKKQTTSESSTVDYSSNFDDAATSVTQHLRPSGKTSVNDTHSAKAPSASQSHNTSRTVPDYSISSFEDEKDSLEELFAIIFTGRSNDEADALDNDLFSPVNAPTRSQPGVVQDHFSTVQDSSANNQASVVTQSASTAHNYSSVLPDYSIDSDVDLHDPFLEWDQSTGFFIRCMVLENGKTALKRCPASEEAAMGPGKVTLSCQTAFSLERGVLHQGCWAHSSAYVEEQCTVGSCGSNARHGDVHFCCCRGPRCNAHFFVRQDIEDLPFNDDYE